MRKTIHLTGRKQLPQNAFDFRFTELNGRRVATLAVADTSVLRKFPPGARIRVKLNENKLVHILDFGTIGHPSIVAELQADLFRAPSCQVRIVNRSGDRDGVLLGSTKSWTLTSGGEPDGILLFQPAPIAPRLWSLDIRDQEQPILYIDENIPDASLWARTDPVFTACVLPSVISQILRKILDTTEPPEDGWESDWLSWAEMLMPGAKPPFRESFDEKTKWIDELIAVFSAKHDLAGHVLTTLSRREEVR